MVFQQYYLDCLSHASYLIGDTEQRSCRRGRPAARRRPVPRRRGRGRPARSPTSSRRTSTPTSSPATSSWRPPPAPPSSTATPPPAGRVPHRDPRRRRSHLARRRSTSRSSRRRATPRSRSRSSSASTAPTTRPYGVLTGDTLFIGDVGRPDLLAAVGVHRRRPGPPALPLAARQAADAARRDQGVPRPRRRLGVRQEPLHRDRRRPSASSVAPTTRSHPMSIDDFVEAVTEGQSVAPLYFLFAATKNRQERELLDERRIRCRR